MDHHHNTNPIPGTNGLQTINHAHESGDRFESDCYKKVMRICTDVETFLGIFNQDRRNTVDRRKNQDKEKSLDANCCFYQGDLDRRKQVNRRNMERRNDSGKGDNKGVGYQNKRRDDISEMDKAKSIKEMVHMLEQLDKGDNEILKIKIYLLLVQLHSKENDKKIRDKYFYEALKIAIKSLGEEFSWTDYEKNIISIYLSNIDSTHQKIFRDSISDEYLPILYRQIIAEYKIQELEKKKKKDNVIHTLGGVGTKPVNAITKELDSIFPDGIQFSIISDATNMVIIEHRGKNSECLNLNNSFRKIPISLDILGKEESYSCYWHLEGCANPENYYSDNELETIIKPKIESAIRHQILELVIETQKYHNYLESIKETMKGLSTYENIDFSHLIMGILGRDSSNLYQNKLQENPEYVNELSKAINIANKIEFYDNGIPIDYQEITQQIDSILGESIKRSILDMVTTMLLHARETSNGLGYPFGHNKQIIPFEGKIYQIIRTYVILFHKEKEESIHTMKTGGKIGYLEPNILQTFLDYLNISTSFPEFYPPQNSTSVVTPYRAEIYTLYIDMWHNIFDKNQKIKESYHIYQLMKLETNNHQYEIIKNEITHTVGMIHLEIFNEVNRMQVFLLKRHEVAKSDENGKFGSDDEPLSETGKKNAREFGEILQHTTIDYIRTSGKKRAIETGEITCQYMNMCDTGCSDCSMIRIEKGLENPIKDDPSRYYPKMRTIADNNVGLHRVMKDLMTQLKEEVIVIITHRDPARVFLDTLDYTMPNNTKNIVPFNSVIELYLIGNTLIPHWQEKFIFPVLKWEPILGEINTFSQEIFGDIFLNIFKINPIKLHKRFLDFCNSMYEKSPEIFQKFIEKLEQGNYTNHIPNILKTAQVIK